MIRLLSKIPPVLAVLLGLLLAGCSAASTGDDQPMSDSIETIVELEQLRDLHPDIPLPQLPEGWMASGLVVEPDGYQIEVHWPVADGYQLAPVCIGQTPTGLTEKCMTDLSSPKELGDGWFWVSAAGPGEPVPTFSADPASLEAGIIRYSEVMDKN